jgi:hypothetical protein
MYGETLIQNKQNNLVKNFGNVKAPVHTDSFGAEKNKRKNMELPKKTADKVGKIEESDDSIFADSDKEEKTESLKEEKQLIDIKLNLKESTGPLHKRETIREESDEEGLFVR